MGREKCKYLTIGECTYKSLYIIQFAEISKVIVRNCVKMSHGEGKI